MEQLPRVVPVVEGLVGVDPLVALEANQPLGEGGRERPGGLRLPDPCLALEEERFAERDGEVQGGGEPIIGEITLLSQEVL